MILVSLGSEYVSFVSVLLPSARAQTFHSSKEQISRQQRNLLLFTSLDVLDSDFVHWTCALIQVNAKFGTLSDWNALNGQKVRNRWDRVYLKFDNFMVRKACYFVANHEREEWKTLKIWQNRTVFQKSKAKRFTTRVHNTLETLLSLYLPPATIRYFCTLLGAIFVQFAMTCRNLMFITLNNSCVYCM